MRRDQQVTEAIRDTLTQLSGDAFHPTLKTHKLKGNATMSVGRLLLAAGMVGMLDASTTHRYVQRMEMIGSADSGTHQDDGAPVRAGGQHDAVRSSVSMQQVKRSTSVKDQPSLLSASHSS